MVKYFFVFVSILCFSCAQQPKTIIAPMDRYEKDGITIPVYDFQGLEEVLVKDDDTIRIVNFWATWCKPCVAELPVFEKLNEHYTSQNVAVILVSLDMESQIQTKLIPFIEKKKIQSKVLVLDDPDANTWIPKVDKNWTGSIPATLIYKGKERYFYEQSFTYETLEAALKKVL